ncbi:MAG: membrane protein insertase YidC [Planctomycetota bacterium]
MSDSRPADNASRQATFAIMILLVAWFFYMQATCIPKPPTSRDNRPAGDNSALANGPGASATTNNNTAAAGNGTSSPSTAGNTHTPAPVMQPRISPRADGKWMRDPETGEYFNGDVLYNGKVDPPRKLIAVDEPPSGVQSQPGIQPDPTPAQTQPRDGSSISADAPPYSSSRRLGLQLVEDEAFNTPKLQLQFARRGGSLAGVTLVGFPGMSDRDHRTSMTPDNYAVRPFAPDRLAFSAEMTLPGSSDPGLLARVLWDYLGHEVTTDGGVTTHVVRFRYQPQVRTTSGDVVTTGPALYAFTRTYTWNDQSYEIRTSLGIENLGDAPITFDGLRVYGPSLFTGFFHPDESDLLWFHADPTGARVWGTQLSTGASKDTPLPAEGVVKYQMLQFLHQGFESSTAPDLRYSLRADPGRGSRDIHWIAQSVDFMVAAMFAPEVTDADQSPPRVLEARMTAIDARMTNDEAVPNSTPSRWQFLPSMQFGSITVEPHQTRSVEIRSYIGPKLEQPLTTAGLTETAFISYQSLEWLARPMLAAMNFFHSIVGNWGISIILLTLLVRGLLLPVSYWSQYKMQMSMAGMKRVQPKMEKLRKKYKDDKQKLQAEMFKLYREENVSFGGLFQGCILMLLQMPIWIALFGMFRYCTDFVGAEFLWIADLSKTDALVTIAQIHLPGLPIIGTWFDNMLTPAGVLHLNILPMLVMTLMYYQTQMQQKMQTAMQTPEQQQQQKIMMGCMFFMFFFLFYNMPAGFNLYFLATSLYALIEMRYIKKIVAAKVEAAQPGGAAAKPAN